MKEVSTLGVDLSKSVFQVHGAAADGSVVFRKKLSRSQFAKFMAKQPTCLVAMEACGSAHYWAREVQKPGHEVRLIAPIYVKPFVKRQKNDAADAEAIVEAVGRPNMRFVAIKTEEQQAQGATKGSWLAHMIMRKPRMVIAIALANKMARTIWAMLTKGEDYKNPMTEATT